MTRIQDRQLSVKGRRAKVRDVVKLIEDDGLGEMVTRGSHRQFKHPTKPGVSPLRDIRRTT